MCRYIKMRSYKHQVNKQTNFWSRAGRAGRRALVGIDKGLRYYGPAINAFTQQVAMPITQATGRPELGFGVAAAGQVAQSYSMLRGAMDGAM